MTINSTKICKGVLEMQKQRFRRLVAQTLAVLMVFSSLAFLPAVTDTLYAQPGLVLPTLPDVSTVNTTPQNVIGTIQLAFIGEQAYTGANLVIKPVLSRNTGDAPANAEAVSEAIMDASGRATTAGVWEVRFPQGNLYTAYDPARSGFSIPYDVPNDAQRYYLEEYGNNFRIWDAENTPGLIFVYTTSIELRDNVVVNIPRGTVVQASRIPIHWPRWGGDPYAEDHVGTCPQTQPRLSVFYGVTLRNVTMMGEGIIDGGGGYRSPFIQHGHNQTGGDGVALAAFTDFIPGEDPPWFPGGAWYHPGTEYEPITYTGNFIEQGIIEHNPDAVFHRPQNIIYIRDSIGVQVYHLTLRNSIRWTAVIELCYDVHMSGIIIRNPPHWTGREADGIDLNTTSRVIVEYVDIETGDDAMCIKPQRDYFQGRRAMNGSLVYIVRPYPYYQTRTQHDVLVRNSILRTNCNAVKIGTGTQVDFTRFHVYNIEVDDHRGWDREPCGGLYGTDEYGNPPSLNAPFRSSVTTAAISVQTNDGGNMSDFTFEDFTIHSVDTAMFIGHQQRLRVNVYTHNLGYIRNVLFRNIVTYRADRTNQINSQVHCDVTGNNIRIENIIFENITHHTAENWGNLTLPPFMNGSYPDANGFGPMPAFGLFARNVTGLHIIGNNTFTGTEIGMRRPMFMFDDVIGYSGDIFTQNPPEIAAHLPVHARFPMRDADYVAEFRVTDTAIYRNFRPWTVNDAGELVPGSRWANNYWVTRSNTVSQQFSIIGHESVRDHRGTGFAKGPNNDGNQTREYIFLNLPENWNDNGLPASAYWENYHISLYVRPGHHERWREPATTSIVYRAPSGLTGPLQNFARDNHMSVNLARSNRGFVRLGGRGEYMAPGATSHVLQVGLAEVAHPQRGGPTWDETPFFRMDIVVDGPYISIYVDGVEFVRDFYDEVWDLDLPYARRGTVGLGGNAGANAEFKDFSITRIYSSELLATSGEYNQHTGNNFFIPIEHRGNYVFRVRNTTTGEWLEDGVDFTRQWPYATDFISGTAPGITLQSTYLSSLNAGQHGFEVVFNLGGIINENGRYSRSQMFNLTVCDAVIPVFGLQAFNNGVINNASLANSGLIRVWTRLDGVNAMVGYEGLTITAVFPSGECAMDLVRINQPWADPGNVNLIDIYFRAPWQRIYFTATYLGQVVELTLINPEYEPVAVPEFSLQAFNNGIINNQSLADSGLIRIWTRLDGIAELVPYDGFSITAVLPGGECAKEFVRINRPWGNQNYVNSVDVNFRAQWQYIYFTASAFGQTVELLLINPSP